MKISIIIPTYNEAENIGKLIDHLLSAIQQKDTEIIISDGGSADSTTTIANRLGVIVHVSTKKGRAAQMNEGASVANGDVLYFVHADTFPPTGFINDIEKAINMGYDMGRYQTRFNSSSLLLQLNAFFARFDWEVCYGGDQTMFITKKAFNDLGGFDNSMLIMEEFEFVKRARQKYQYTILQNKALVSARKYNNNSWLTVQRANARIVNMYKHGASQQEMIDTYKKLLKPY
ncbi:MAG: TIGR04283 family arsenosugar biosynthesis glycosyltransferase [Chitinophagaceae bacterium]|nr:TIGR04283 family arsenosugar biosynthesis glycosyltransferase [Chitinophagaceae bacterium]